MVGLPLSETQRYFLDVLVQDGFDPTWQHVATSFVFGAELDPARAGAIARDLVERHPILQTRLGYDDGEPRLCPSEDGPPPCTVMDLRGRSEDELDLALSRWADQPFDLGRGPLWRFAFALGDGRTVFALVCHHLVADAASVWLLSKDCIHIAFDAPLAPCGPPFSAFAAQERELLAGPAGRERLQYWSEHLDGATPVLATDRRPRPHELSGADVSPVSFAADAGDALQAQARSRRVTPLPLLATKVFTAVKQASGQDDVLCGVVTDLRGPQFANTVGPFTDLMLVRDRLPTGEDDAERLAKVRNAFFVGWQNQLPVAYLRERMPSLRGPDHAANPCDVLLNFLPAPPAADWQAIVALCGELSPALYFPRRRLAPPSRRFHAPLFIFLFAMIERLDGWIYGHRLPQLAALNAAVAEELNAAVAGLTTAASELTRARD